MIGIMMNVLHRCKKYLTDNKKVLLTLGLIFLGALLLRLVKLGTLPVDPHEDEIMSGYVGRYILENGKDLYGNPWPLLYFNKFGDYYIILPMYLSGISTFLFGVTAFAVRFPAALMGSLAVLPIFFITKEILRNDKVALLSALLVAITPWHIILSRSSGEGVTGSTIFLFGIYFLLVSLRNQNLRILFTAVTIFLVTYLIYHPFRIYVPLSLLGAGFLFDLFKKNRNYILIFSILTIFFFGLTFYISSTPWGKGRFTQTSVLGAQSGVSIKINTGIYGDSSVLEARFFHNKVVVYGKELLSQYFSYLSPNYLFITGGVYSRYSVHETGLLYLAYLFSLAALYKAKQFPIKNKSGVLFWAFLFFLSI
ncbi:MAG: glycosyltransferase family 39 protein, partial [Patescibacteria group bacterium]